MVESIEMNKNYAIYLSDLYGSSKINAQVIGTTVIDSLNKNDEDYNIYQTYFEPFGLGLATYYTAIQSDTVIYICAPITSLEPFTIDTSSKVYVPSSLIDMYKTSEYVKCYNISLNVYPVIKNFDTDDERDSYIEELKEKVKNRLSNIIEFNTLGLEIDSSYAPIYMTTEDVNAINEERSNLYNKYNDRQNKFRSAQEQSASALNNAISSYNTAKSEYEDMRMAESTKVAQLQELISQYEKLIKDNSGS